MMRKVFEFVTFNLGLIGLQLLGIGIGLALWFVVEAAGLPIEVRRYLLPLIAIASLVATWWLVARAYDAATRRYYERILRK